MIKMLIGSFIQESVIIFKLMNVRTSQTIIVFITILYKKTSITTLFFLQFQKIDNFIECLLI